MFNKNRACQHLRTQGLKPTEASRFSSLVKKWHDNSGPEWTVSRLKDLEQYAKDRKLGKNPRIPIGWATRRTRRHYERFADDLLHELFSSKEFDLGLALQFTRLTTAISLRRWKSTTNKKTHKKERVIVPLAPSKKQLEKSLNAIEGPPEKEFNHQLYNSVEESFLASNKISNRIKKYPDSKSVVEIPMIFWPHNETNAPYFDEEGKMCKSPRSGDSRVWSLEVLYNDYSFSRFLASHTDYVTRCIYGEVDYQLPRPSQGSSFMKLPAGSWNIIQEPGCKARVVANPFLVVQAINEPLKLQLSKILRRIPEAVVFDHQVGREKLKHWLSQEEEVFSIDASSFTDRFPLKWQLAVLRKYLSLGKINQDMYDAFLVTTQHGYYSTDLGRVVNYNFGQSQGLGPSFFLATIAHYELLETLKLGLPNCKEDAFCLVGDDVIIRDRELAHLYMLWMDSCNVDINQSKTIISNSLGEFAGSQIYDDVIIKRPKLNHLKSNDQVVSLLDIYHSMNKQDKFLLHMEKEFADNALKVHLPQDFGGRRHLLYDTIIQPKALNDLKIIKARLVKELKDILTYNSKDVIKFFLNKRKVTTGILHSSHRYIDNPSDMKQLKSFLSSSKKTRPLALELGKIEDLRDAARRFLKMLRSLDNEQDIRNLLNKFDKLMHRQGRLLDREQQMMFLAKDSLYQISKLVGVEQEQLKALDEATRRRKLKSQSNGDWSKLLQ